MSIATNTNEADRTTIGFLHRSSVKCIQVLSLEKVEPKQHHFMVPPQLAIRRYICQNCHTCGKYSKHPIANTNSQVWFPYSVYGIYL